MFLISLGYRIEMFIETYESFLFKKKVTQNVCVSRITTLNGLVFAFEELHAEIRIVWKKGAPKVTEKAQK